MRLVLISAIALLLVLSRTTISEAAKGPECLGLSLEYMSSHRITTKACPLNDAGPVGRESDSHFSEALHYLRDRQYSKAIDILSNMIATGKRLDIAYSLRAQAYKDVGNDVKAVNDYAKSISINPRLIESYINRGNIWMKKGFWDDAILDYTSALQIDSSNHIALTNRGYARFMAKKGLGAADDLNKAIALEPAYAPAYFYHAAVMFRAYERESASVDLTRYLELNPSDADAISLKKIVDDEIELVRNRQTSGPRPSPKSPSSKSLSLGNRL